MRTRLFLLLLAAAAPAFGQSLSLDVVVMSTGGASKARSGLQWDPGGRPMGTAYSAEQRDYSQRREKESAIGLEAQLRNLGRSPAAAKLEWYFLAKPLKGRGDFIFDEGHQEVEVAAASTQKLPLLSDTLHSKVVKRLHTTNGVNALGQAIPPTASINKSGHTLAGWIVRMTVPGYPVQVKASSPSLLAMGKDSGLLQSYERKKAR